LHINQGTPSGAILTLFKQNPDKPEKLKKFNHWKTARKIRRKNRRQCGAEEKNRII
jgi:hypothetical protein